jgi:Tol biopolymer transport system component
VEPLKLPPHAYQTLRISPDGKRVAVGTDDGREAIVWVYDLSGTSSIRRLTFGGRNRFPIWSADGQRIAFQSDREGDQGIWWQPADGSGAAERLTKAEQGVTHVPGSWHPKGDRFSFSVTKDADLSLWIFSIQDKKAAPFGDVRSREPIGSAFSPDGRWLAYWSSEKDGFGSRAIFVQPFPSTGAKYQISSGASPRWTRDGKELVYDLRLGFFGAVRITTQPSFTFGSPVRFPKAGILGVAPTTEGNFDIAPDGRIIGPIRAAQSQSGTPVRPQIQVVLNWFEELKQRVPVP